MMQAPRMTDIEGKRASRSIATGWGSGRRGRPYFSLSCGNLAEVLAYIRWRVTGGAYGAWILLREDAVHSKGDYMKVDIDVSEYADGLPWGPTHRKIALEGLRLAETALRECFDQR
jgi:hypothetical protein